MITDEQEKLIEFYGLKLPTFLVDEMVDCLRAN